MQIGLSNISCVEIVGGLEEGDTVYYRRAESITYSFVLRKQTDSAENILSPFKFN